MIQQSSQSPQTSPPSQSLPDQKQLAAHCWSRLASEVVWLPSLILVFATLLAAFTHYWHSANFARTEANFDFQHTAALLEGSLLSCRLSRPACTTIADSLSTDSRFVSLVVSDPVEAKPIFERWRESPSFGEIFEYQGKVLQDSQLAARFVLRMAYPQTRYENTQLLLLAAFAVSFSALCIFGLRWRIRVLFKRCQKRQGGLDAFYDMLNDWAWEQDENFRFTHFSSGLTPMSNTINHENVGKCRWEIGEALHPEGWAAHRAVLEAHLPFRDFEFKRFDRDGSVTYISVSGRPIFDDDGKFCGYYGVARDISARKIIEEKLARSETRFQALFEFLPLPLSFNLESEGYRKPHWNRAWFECFGYTKEVAQGHSGDQFHLWPEQDDRERYIAAVLASNTTYSCETRLSRADGEIRDVRIHGLCVNLGGYRQILTVYQDMTESRHAERVLREANAGLELRIETCQAELAAAKKNAEQVYASRRIFMANMSHEIRVPMSAIIGLTHLLRREMTDCRTLSRIDKIVDAAQHLLDVITDILDLAKIESGNLQIEAADFNVDQLLLGIADMVRDDANAKGLEIIVDTNALPPTLHGDGKHLGQILRHFMSNAVRFTECGHVLLRCKLLKANGERLTVRFEVIDTGLGIPPELQSDIFMAFERFDISTRRLEGAGLGLALAYRLAILMGGKPGCESVPGKGCCFWVEVPLLRSHDDAAWPQLPNELNRSLRVLVADASQDGRTSLQSVLEKLGIKANTVSSGEMAVEAMLQAEHSETPFDCILLDERMPGLDGFAAARRIRILPLKKQPALVLMSAENQAKIRERLMASGFSGYVSKPVTSSTLYDTLIKLLRAPSPWTAEKPATAQDQDHGSEPMKTDEQPAENTRRANILLVEDSMVTQEVVVELLDSAGLGVDSAENGLKALEMVAQHRYDLILMDIQMPYMDGLEATRQIRQMPGYEQTPILAMTANGSTTDRKVCLDAGMNDHLTKPIDPEFLFESLVRWLNLSDEPWFTPHKSVDVPLPAAVPEPMPEKQVKTCVDWDGLKQRYQKRAAFIAKLVQRTIDFYQKTPAAIDACIASKDFEGIGRIAHSLKGSSGNLMAGSLMEIAQRCNLAVRQKQPETLSLAKDMQIMLEKLLVECEQWLKDDNQLKGGQGEISDTCR